MDNKIHWNELREATRSDLEQDGTRICKSSHVMNSHTTQGEYQDGVAQGSEEDSKLKYPSLLCSSSLNLGDEIHLKGVEL